MDTAVFATCFSDQNKGGKGTLEQVDLEQNTGQQYSQWKSMQCVMNWKITSSSTNKILNLTEWRVNLGT